MQGAQKTEPRGVYGYTLSGAVCSATQLSFSRNKTIAYFRFQPAPFVTTEEH